MMKHTCRSRKGKGFTLIELLIVVAIIAILAAIAVPNFLEAQTRAKVSRAKADMRTMVTALETYRIDYNKYISAETNSDLLDHGNAEGDVLTPYSALRLLTTPISYLSAVPQEAPFQAYKGYETNGVREKGYQYHGGDLWVRERPGICNGTFLPEEWLSAHYKLSGVGPSKKYSALVNTLYDRKPYIVPYEPTNGTVSVGDILYSAGNAGGWHSFK